jgi:WD40 repeat protein
MSDTDQEHIDHDPSLEIVDLESLDPAHANAENKHWLPLYVAQKLPGLQFLRERRKTRLAVTSVIAIVGLIILLIVSGVISPLIAKIAPAPARGNAVPNAGPRISTIKPVILNGQQEGMACFVNAIWSPDSRHIAAFGYQHDCPQDGNTYEPGLLYVYDARSARLAAQLHPDTAILSALKQRYTQAQKKIQGAPEIIYYNGIWSPDGGTIALIFNAGPSTNPAVWYSGVALITGNSTANERVFLQQVPGADTSQSYLVWDLDSGAATLVPYAVKAPNSSFFYPNIAATPSYHWDMNGQLVPDIPHDSGGPPDFPSDLIGSPDNYLFSVWQPGAVQWVTQNGNVPAHLPGVFVWQSFFPAWSPDGRYLIDSLSIAGRLTVPGQKQLNHQDLTYLSVAELGTLRVRDKALEQVMQVLSSPASIATRTIGATVAWRPDGRVLAAFDSDYVDIYDCATGRKLVSLLPQNVSQSELGLVGLLSWSPNGAYLFLAGANWGPVQLWNARQFLG